MINGLKNQEDNMMMMELEQRFNCQRIEFNQEQIESQNIQKKNETYNFVPQIQNEIIGILNNQFYLVKKIGSGSSGSVYLSYTLNFEKNLKNFFAVKIMKVKDPKGNFLNNCEVNFLEKMNHKNILKVYGHGSGTLKTCSGSCHQVYYIIMDYLNHGSFLTQIEGNRGFGEDLGRLIFAQLLDGLEAIHNSNIVHRDIKLENIMLSGDDYTLKYVDFGFATEKSLGYLYNYLGTPNYAAPELHLKKPYLGVYEDIFSLGVTLFIIVTGYLPFILPLPNDSLYHYIAIGDYNNFWRKRNIKVSSSFMELFNNLVAFDPTQRPSISEIRQSKWMQEIKFELMPSLKQEYIKREDIFNQKLRNQKQRMNCNIINNNKENKINKNVDEILNEMKEKKKVEFMNDIKMKLFNMNTEKEKNFNQINKDSLNDSTKEDNNNNNISNNSLQGFITIKNNFLNMKPLMILLKQFFKKYSYNETKKDLDKLKMEISNGEADIALYFEKMNKYIKISFYIENGNKEDLISFKKIMKKFNPK